jgi:transketolase
MSEATPRIIGQRDSYLEALFQIFKRDKNCIFISADNGAPSLDQFVKELPDQFIQVGIAEQQAIAMAAGLAFEGKSVYVYAIAPFVTTRVHEFVKLDMCAMKLPVTLLGVGAGYAYASMGPSHHNVEDISIMRCLPGLEIWSPADAQTAALLPEYMYEYNGPSYIRFDRAGIPDIYNDGTTRRKLANVNDGFFVHMAKWQDTDTVVPHRNMEFSIIASGIMVHRALSIQRYFPNAIVIDVYRIKPFPFNGISRWLGDHPIVTIEEHFLSGGLGSIVAEELADSWATNPLLRMGRTEAQGYCFEYGGRERIWENMGLGESSILERIDRFLAGLVKEDRV